MLITVIEKGSIYALVAASMNLLNGFTGLFSLGQAGFMLIGAYTYAIFTIPAESHDKVYQYFDGGVIKWSIVEILEAKMGIFGHYLGMFIPMLGAGLIVAVIAFLIGIPVLRLKSDYLAIATLGFAEILRAFFQWNTLGPVTNGSNVLRKYTTYDNAVFPVIIGGICIAIILLLINSTYGRAFRAIRDDEIAAEAMGINLFKHKQMSFRYSYSHFIVVDVILPVGAVAHITVYNNVIDGFKGCVFILVKNTIYCNGFVLKINFYCLSTGCDDALDEHFFKIGFSIG
jgi:branched-chain amino acid transport system permease protein